MSVLLSSYITIAYFSLVSVRITILKYIHTEKMCVHVLNSLYFMLVYMLFQIIKKKTLQKVGTL